MPAIIELSARFSVIFLYRIALLTDRKAEEYLVVIYTFQITGTLVKTSWALIGAASLD
jgi:hypothetical protein